MGHRCCSKQKVKRGLWSPEEDERLVKYITTHGHGSWSSVPRLAGLQRCGKSCRLRWINYLRPDLKRGSFSPQEEQIIIDVHRILGNRWAQIAKHLPGRTDNEVKNFWNSCIKKKLIAQGLDPRTHNLIPAHQRSSNSASAPSSSSASSHHLLTSKPLTNNVISMISDNGGLQPFSIITVKDKDKYSNPPPLPYNFSTKSPPPPPPPPPPSFPTPPMHSSPGDIHNPNHASNNLLWMTPAATTDLSPHFPANWVHPNPDSSLVNVPSPAGFGLLVEGNFSLLPSPPPTNNCNTTIYSNSIDIIRPYYTEEEGVIDLQAANQQPAGRINNNMNNIMRDDMEEEDGSGGGFLQEIATATATSFDSSSFDIHELVDPSSLSSSAAASICRDLTSMDDLPWSF